MNSQSRRDNPALNHQVQQLIAKHHADTVVLRRHFHSFPELSGQENNTQEFIMKELSLLGLTPRKIANTGVIADIGGAGKKIVAIRADMDALPLEEQSDKPYRSKNPGISHACGHDGHMAMLLAAARVLCAVKDQLPGSIRLLFQPSEETIPGGAQLLIAEGALDGVDAIIGAHLWQPLPVGAIGTRSGPLMAAGDEFALNITGRGGHGSMPHQTIDPILTAAQLIIALNTITSRNIDPLEPCVLSIGSLHAGSAFNIIPDSVVLNGTVRSFNPVVRRNIFDRIEKIAAGVCAAAGATHTLTSNWGYPPLINNSDVVKLVMESAAHVSGCQNVLDIAPALVAEDFAYYLEHIPGAFIFVGAGNEEQGITYPHHHPKFDIDERALAIGTETLVSSALRLLG